jgi:hypothetical protein
VTSSLFPWGRHPRGCNPLTPISEVLVHLLRLSLSGGCPGGRGKKDGVREPKRATPQFPQGFLQSRKK